MEGFIALLAGFFLFSCGGLNSVSGDSLKPCEFPAIYNFGDSNSATGGSAFDPPQPNKANRICDGYLIIDFIAEHLKLPYLSGYVNSSLKGNFRHGANFAEAGSTIRKPDDTSHPISSVDVQIEQFNEFKSQTTKFYNEAKNDSEKDKLPKQEDFAKALYTFDIGQNDFNDLISMDQLRPTVIDIVNHLASSIQNIYERGARTFRIHNMGPIGCLPKFVIQNQNSSTQGNVDEHGCVKSRNDMAVEFNKQLKEKVIKLRSELSEAAITYVDIYAAKFGLISNAKNLGFGDPFKYCCGTQYLMCGEMRRVNNSTEVLFGDACKEPSKFIYWDNLHYTQTANQLVANQILNGSLVDPPIPITQSCHRQ